MINNLFLDDWWYCFGFIICGNVDVDVDYIRFVENCWVGCWFE